MIVGRHRKNLLCQSYSAFLSEQIVTRQRQVTDSLARGGEDRVAKRGNKWWNSWLSDSSRRSRALGNVDVRLIWNFVDSGHRIVIEIGLLDYTVLCGDLSSAHNARAEDRRSFELCARGLRIYDEPSIHRCVDPGNADLAVITHLPLHDRSHIRQEAAMCRKSIPVALNSPFLCPSGFVGDHFDDIAQPACFPRVGFVIRTVVRIFHVGEVQSAGRSDEVEHILNGIAIGAMGQFIRKALYRECMIDVRHGAQPTYPDMSLRGTVLNADVGKIIREIRPALLQVWRVSINRVYIKDRGDWRKHRPLQPCLGLSLFIDSGLHVHRSYRIVIVKLNIVFAGPDNLYGAPQLLRQERRLGNVVRLRFSSKTAAQQCDMTDYVFD